MDFYFIEQLPQKIQLDMYMTLLVELGGSVQVRRNQFSQYWIPRIKEQMDEDNLSIEYIKQKIKELIIVENE